MLVKPRPGRVPALASGIPFVKMHGLGNDYVFLDCVGPGTAGRPAAPPADPAALSREIADRHFGVGGDGLILILPSERADFRMRIFNADGSEGEMCGNGLRCFAKYVYEQGYAPGPAFTVETGAGILRPEVAVGCGADPGRARGVDLGSDPGDARGTVTQVRVDMGEPRLRRGEIPMAGPPGERVIDAPLRIDGAELRVTAVSMGNPHCLIFVDDLGEVDLPRLGRLVENHPDFPHRTNVEFLQVQGRDELSLRVWERGSGATMACGTGACGAVVAGALTGRTGREATVHLPGGDLRIEWAADNRVYMTGPATEVFRGVYAPR